MLAETIAAAVRLARDPRPAAKLAATRTAGALVMAELAAGGATSPSLPALQPVLIVVLGLDQTSDIQRAGLQVCGTATPAGDLDACGMRWTCATLSTARRPIAASIRDWSMLHHWQHEPPTSPLSRDAAQYNDRECIFLACHLTSAPCNVYTAGAAEHRSSETCRPAAIVRRAGAAGLQSGAEHGWPDAHGSGGDACTGSAA